MEARSSKPKVLIQLDPDPQASVFDAIVAIDAGVDHVLRHGGVVPAAVRDLVYGALFTRGPADLNSTAIFVGGSSVAKGEELFQAVKKTFFGPFRVSVLFDANGCNTTASAAVLAALEGMGGALDGVPAVVLGGTGPVGQRVGRLLARMGAAVAIGSRSLERAQATAAAIQALTGRAVGAFATSGAGDPLARGLERAEVVVAAGAVGVTLLPEPVRRSASRLKVAIDLNAVPPLGIAGLEPTDRGTQRDGHRAWGALGVGATKMKIHKKAVQELFRANDRVLDAEDVLELGRGLG
jgi:hypothetical protein